MAIPDSPLAEPQQIQGNILRPFGGVYQAFLFLSFGNDRDGARAWLGRAAKHVSGTADVRAARNGSGIKPATSLMNVGLTATGLVTLHSEVAGDLVGFDAFWRGPLGDRLDDSGRLTTAAALLGDVGLSDPRCWVIGGPDGPPIDALLTIAAEDRDTLQVAVDRELAAAAGPGVCVLRLGKAAGGGTVQWGRVLLRDGRRVEHFGFVDSISQPGIRGFHDVGRARPGAPVIAAGEFILGCASERRPRSWAPRPVPAPWMWGGSFQVFRRLRQDVERWWERMRENSAVEGGAGGVEEAAARALGRRADGTPLARTDSENPNDFTYRDDKPGSETPRYAHIRKVNPRDDEVFRDRGHKLLRRGIPFGPPFERGRSEQPERGLLFNAYMASIEDQFEFVQRRWANDPEFPSSTIARYEGTRGAALGIDGLDPVLGDDRETASRRLAQEVVRDIPEPAFGKFVTTTGAVYAFAPSRLALRLLAGASSLHTLAVPAG
jgi:Dyp-type peroxidase family